MLSKLPPYLQLVPTLLENARSRKKEIKRLKRVNLKGASQILFNSHDGARIVKLAAVVRCGEKRY